VVEGTLAGFVPTQALTVTVVGLPTVEVVAVKVTVDDPAGTVTVAGKPTVVELLDKVTTMPPVGAAAPIVTVPVQVSPPSTWAGNTEMVLT
jgi:hypothetical protein